jgi:hypothetical protein
MAEFRGPQPDIETNVAYDGKSNYPIPVATGLVRYLDGWLFGFSGGEGADDIIQFYEENCSNCPLHKHGCFGVYASGIKLYSHAVSDYRFKNATCEVVKNAGPELVVKQQQIEIELKESNSKR